MSLNDAPLLASADGCAFTVPLLVVITMLSFVNVLMVPTWPLPVVADPVKFTVPKFANGNTLHVMKQLDGASATHSAELFCAVVEDCVVVYDHARVVFVNTNVYDEPEAFTSAEMLSFGATGYFDDDKFTGAAGYISIQA